VGLVAGGYRAIESLRLEKGYRAWASDITPDDSPHEAGLSFCVSGEKEFNGAVALRARPVSRRLRCVTLADPLSVALGNEPVRVGGEVVGRVTSGGYGYAVARSIAYAYLPAEVEVGAEVEIDIFGQLIPGEVTAERGRSRPSRSTTPLVSGSAAEGRGPLATPLTIALGRPWLRRDRSGCRPSPRRSSPCGSGPRPTW
jgi:4-methylaminobutanoate oxidase (formaldehyde-forming)